MTSQKALAVGIARVCIPAALMVSLAGPAAAQSSALVDAVRSRNHQAIHVLVDRRANVNAREADGATALHWAARVDDLESIRILLRAGADANLANRYGVTPLMLAAINGNADIADALLRSGADATATLPEGESVLMTAARTGNPDVVKALIAHGANVNAKENWLGETALMWAAAEDHGEAARVLVEHGADLNLQSAPTHYPRPTGGQTLLPRGGFTALMFAARENGLEAARVLVNAKADMNRGDADGITALMVAIINGHYDLAAMLIEHGADLDRADVTGMTALYAAVDMNTLQFMHGRPPSKPSGRLTPVDVVRLLLTYGAQPDLALKAPILQRHNTAGNRFLGPGTTPLMRAAKSGDVTLMRMLLDAGADPMLRQRNGNTLLMLAAGYGRRFNQNADSLEYETATEADLLSGVKFCVEQLGQNVNVGNETGETPMHIAAGESIVRYLAAHGGRLDAKTRDGKTPYDVAIGRKDGSGRQLLPGTLVAFRELGAPKSIGEDAKPAELPVVNINVGEDR
jgi:ankyrin repeat protein